MFFDFIKPYLKLIDNGFLYRNPFSWLYAFLAIANLFVPFYVFYVAIDNHVFDGPAKLAMFFLLAWFIIAFASWVSFQLWWDRKNKVMKTSEIGDDFVATPVFAHLTQTLGEWFGTWVGLVGFLVGLLATIIVGDEGRGISRSIGIPFIKSGLLFTILMPVYGFFIIIITRFMAEQFRALSSIANNTKKKFNISRVDEPETNTSTNNHSSRSHEEKSPYKVCLKCGVPYSENDSFCQKCGTKI